MKSILIQEVWKPVPNYEGLYDVSNFGRVKSLNYCGRYNISILKIHKDKKGYFCVTLTKNHTRKTYKVHRLVYEAFNGTIPDDMQVNHINEIKTDNSLWNLNLMTNQENCNYGRRNLNLSKSHIGIKRPYMSLKLTNGKLSKPVAQLTLDNELVKVWPSAAEAGRNGFVSSMVTACCRGKRYKHHGFRWLFI